MPELNRSRPRAVAVTLAVLLVIKSEVFCQPYPPQNWSRGQQLARYADPEHHEMSQEHIIEPSRPAVEVQDAAETEV
ncbi:unnamed protein product, partial [Symbiodinium pilosum]